MSKQRAIEYGKCKSAVSSRAGKSFTDRTHRQDPGQPQKRILMYRTSRTCVNYYASFNLILINRYMFLLLFTSIYNLLFNCVIFVSCFPLHQFHPPILRWPYLFNVCTMKHTLVWTEIGCLRQFEWKSNNNRHKRARRQRSAAAVPADILRADSQRGNDRHALYHHAGRYTHYLPPPSPVHTI